MAVLPRNDSGVALVLLSDGAVALAILALLQRLLTGSHGVDGVVIRLQVLPLLLAHSCDLCDIVGGCCGEVAVACEPCGVAGEQPGVGRVAATRVRRRVSCSRRKS